MGDAPHILLFDPGRVFAAEFRPPLEARGWKVCEVRSEGAAERMAGSEPANVVIKSQSASEGKTGLMERLRALCGDTEFIFASPESNVRMAMDAVRRGAFDCLPLPCEAERLVESVSRALAHQMVAAENGVLLARLHSLSPPAPLAGESPAMRHVQETLSRVADTDVTILLTGESGTGKELIARRVHEMSARRKGPFVAVNCAALPDSLIESEFFGHRRGAFTGAVEDKPGRFELARGGTLFLDEIGELSPVGQADLLRVLEDGVFRPLGSRTTVRTDARIIAATNRDLEALCAAGRFREDLLYRINVIALHLPPLRERPDDIPRLAENFVRHFAARHGRARKEISAGLRAKLCSADWRGNVRQLRNAIERMVLLVPERVLLPSHLPSPLSPVGRGGVLPAMDESMGLAGVEAAWIEHVLGRCGGNRTEAARRLGISRRSLHYKLARRGRDDAPG